MKDKIAEEGIREKLIIAGIEEMSQNGISDFSLRRVATNCHISCAAPYKHFKNKDEMISEIIKYISEKYLMLEREVISAFGDDIKMQIIQATIAYIRFYLGNPNFRAVMIYSKADVYDGNKFHELLSRYFHGIGLSDNEIDERENFIKALTYGYLHMLETEEMENTNASFDMIKKAITLQL